MDFSPSPRCQEYLKRVRAFVRERIEPVETALLALQLNTSAATKLRPISSASGA